MKAKTLVKKAGMGMLGAMVVGGVANRFAPEYAGLAGIAGAYMTGGAIGALGSVLLQGGLGTSNSGTVTI